MNDALGNEIVIGGVYGYSQTDTVFVGRVTKLTAKRVSLDTISRKWFLYGEQYERGYAGDADIVHVPSHLLFPVNEKEMKNEYNLADEEKTKMFDDGLDIAEFHRLTKKYGV